MVFIVVLILVGIYVYKYKRAEVEKVILKIKYGNDKNELNGNVFINKKLTDEFDKNLFIDSTIYDLNNNDVNSVEIYPNEMRIDNKTISYRNIGMNSLEGMGECKALACYIQSNLVNKNKYEINEISDIYKDADIVGYSMVDKSRKYNV